MVLITRGKNPPIFGDPKRYLYFWGKGINKQKTNKQIKCVCLVKSAVCDVALCSVYVKQ